MGSCHSITLLQDIVYDKPKTLDSTFDAGGNTASALIAVSNMCEFINIQTILGKILFNLRHYSFNAANVVLCRTQVCQTWKTLFG